MTDTLEYPLITFALFAYNQEDLIQEAVEGALAQTYQPLEIIISDDCSTDQTYEVIKAKAASYSGPHKLVIRQNKTNLGISGHVNQIMNASHGKIIVLSAGDDIASPERTEKTAQAFQGDSTCLVHTSVIYIDNEGKEVEGAKVETLLTRPHSIYDIAKSMSIDGRKCCAIKRNLYEKYGKISYLNAYEDLVYGFRAALEGNCKYIDEPLVFYRIGSGVSTDTTNLQDASLVREHLCKYLTVRIDVLKQRLADIRKVDVEKSSKIVWMIKLSLYHAIGRKLLLTIWNHIVK